MDRFESIDNSLMPHGNSFLWQPGVLWLNVLSDLFTALAFFSLFLALLYIVFKRKNLAIKPLFVTLSVLVLASALNQLMAAITVWYPAYWLGGGVKLITALASLITAALVWKYLPGALSMPSREQLSQTNTELERLNSQLQSEIHIRTQTEQRFRSLVESAPDAIIIVDEQGSIQLVNNQALKWFGYSQDELIGQAVELLIPDRLSGGHVAKRETYIAHPQVRPMGAELDLHGRRKDGSEFPVEISLSPLETEQGLLITSMIRDVSARRQSELSRRRLQTRYQDLVNNLTVGVYRTTHSLEGKFVEVNPALIDIFEAESPEQLQQYSINDFFLDPVERDELVNKLGSEGRVNGEVRMKTLNGKEFYAFITAAKELGHNKDEYVDGILKDITVRKTDELQIRELNRTLKSHSTELEAVNHELESFSYSVSHDLRAPLRSIDGFSRILQRDYSEQLDSKARDLLDRVRNSAQQMADLIDDMLNLSRVSRTELRYEYIDLAEIAQQVVADLQLAEPDRQVEFSVQQPLSTRADKRLMKVVMDNLLGNAWKFTSQREQAHIEMGCFHDKGETIYFVRDDGAGFDMEYVDKLFGAFQRLHDAHSFAGTGIGLATVKRILHKHHGRIWAEAQIDRGATFYFTLDRELADVG